MLKYLHIVLAMISISFFSLTMSAQIEKVFVEVYYISDRDDATNINGSILPEGSKTYRVYVDLLPGYKLRKLYGDKNHAILFSSTSSIFNHLEDGVSLAYSLNKNRYFDNTVALDSWLTIGQTSRSGNDVVFGVPKINDTNGSFIGGLNNDGGSEAVADGLLKNSNPLAGIPLTISDGMMPNAYKSAEWNNLGFFDILTGEDLTIFGSANSGSTFKSYDAYIQNSGSIGVFPDSNQILVAQITTQGELSFKLNLEVEDPMGNFKKYVASDSILLVDEILLPALNYPPVCGCQDPDYLEYNVNFSCNDKSKCLNPIVFGCMDPNACNYNTNANFNVDALCCYIGYCNDENIELVCPDLPIRKKDELIINLIPNPVISIAQLYHNINSNSKYKIEVLDIFGKTVLEERILQDNFQEIDLSNLKSGVYIINVYNSIQKVSKKFVKI